MIWDWMKYVLVRCCTSKKSSSFALSFTRFHHSLGTPLCPLPISSALFPIHKSARMKNHRSKPWNQLWKSMKICTDDNFDSRLNCWRFPQSTFFRTAPLTLTLLLKKKIKYKCPKFPFSRCLCQHYAGSKPSSHADPFSLFVCWRFLSTLEHGFWSKLLCSDWFSHTADSAWRFLHLGYLISRSCGFLDLERWSPGAANFSI